MAFCTENSALKTKYQKFIRKSTDKAPRKLQEVKYTLNHPNDYIITFSCNCTTCTEGWKGVRWWQLPEQVQPVSIIQCTLFNWSFEPNIYNNLAVYPYFHTLMAPSLLLDIRSLWFNLTEAKESIESWWQPAVSVAAAARIAFPVNRVAIGRLLVSCSRWKENKFRYKWNKWSA